MTDAIFQALTMAFAMGWQILWPLILGFTLSGIVQAVVSHSEMRRLLPDDRPRSIAIALGLGAASSSCSYVAVALARSVFRKGANFTAAMAFELASTNLVLELTIIIIVLMGWQFALAEFARRSWSPSWCCCFVCFSRRAYYAKAWNRRIVAFPAGWKATPGWTWPLSKAARFGSG